MELLLTGIIFLLSITLLIKFFTKDHKKNPTGYVPGNEQLLLELYKQLYEIESQIKDLEGEEEGADGSK